MWRAGRFTRRRRADCSCPRRSRGLGGQSWPRPGAAGPVGVYYPFTPVPYGRNNEPDAAVSLLDWAKQANAYILEDDYDSEYRFAGRPLAALQGLDEAERVIYSGTFSKVLFPALRIGYLILPPPLVEAFPDRAWSS